MLFQNADRIASGARSNSLSPRVIVIGAGAIGLYVASQLAARDCQVIVIEAGNADLGRYAAESYTTAGRPHTGIRLGRGRNLGGTTSLWGGQLVEFQPIDFHGRTWMPNSQWPVGYDEIYPYYRPTYLNLGLAERVLDDREVWKGISCERPDLGPEFEVFFTRWMGTPNFAELFSRQIQHDERISVLIGHTAIGFEGTGGRLSAVRVANDQGQSRWIAGDIFLLSAGTIENARLLLHTGHDSAWKAPWKENPNIGRFFQDHLGGPIASFHPTDKKQFFKAFCNAVYAGHKFQPKIRLSNETLCGLHLYNTQVFFAFESEVSEHLVYLKQFLKAALYGRKATGLGDFFRKSTGMARYLVPLMWRYLWDHRIFVPTSANILMHVQAEHAPISESSIRVDYSHVDAFGLPRAILDWRLAGDELVSIRAFAVQIRGALREAGIGELRIDEELLSLNPKFLTKLGDTYHQSGGAVMGKSEQDGVVDRNLRVFGTENLYVGGASVFRTTSNANVTFTALAFATRLVEHLTHANLSADRNQIPARFPSTSNS